MTLFWISLPTITTFLFQTGIGFSKNRGMMQPLTPPPPWIDVRNRPNKSEILGFFLFCLKNPGHKKLQTKKK